MHSTSEAGGEAGGEARGEAGGGVTTIHSDSPIGWTDHLKTPGMLPLWLNSSSLLQRKMLRGVNTPLSRLPLSVKFLTPQ